MNIRVRIKFIFYITAVLVMVLSPNIFAAEEYALEDLYRIALEKAERIKISEEDLFIAERGKDKALSALLPTLSAFGEYKRYSEKKESNTPVGSFITQPEKSSSWGLRLDQSLSLGGREITSLKISKSGIESGRYNLYAIKEDYLLNVSSAYFDVLKAAKAVEIVKANLERLSKHRDASNARLKAGEATKTVVLRAEAELSGARSDMLKSGNGLRLAKAVLARIAGINGEYSIREPMDNSRYTTGIEDNQSFESFKETALNERAEIKSNSIKKKIAEDQVKYAKGSFMPTLSVAGVYLKMDEDPSSSFSNTKSVYGTLSLNFPFFEGGLRRAEVREALSKKRQAEFAFEDLKKTINIDVENACLDVKTQAGILKSLEDQLTFAKDNYNAVSKQFEYGLANSIDVMDANTLLVTSERQLSEAKYNHQLAILKLKRATGTLLTTVNSKQ
ncbi:MAG: TolC family protein [Thermodesulfovibrionales bacterium]